MTVAARYAAGVAGVGLAAALLSAAMPPDGRGAVGLAAALAVAVQGPLGWWLVRSLGQSGLLRVWGLGMLARLALLALAAWVVAPLASVPAGTLLISLAALLLALLFVEIVAIGVT